MGPLSQEEFLQWSISQATYERHRPETTLLYQIVEEHWPVFQAELGSQGKHLPKFGTQEFEEYLKCGRLEHGFLRVQCESCHHEKLVAFSCKRRGFCSSCGARRMADSAAHLVDEVLPEKPIRQWVLSVPFQLRYLFATRPEVMSKVLAIVHRVISTFLTKPPTSQDLDKVTQKIAQRVSRYLEKAGYLVRDAESEYLDLYSDEEDVMQSIVGASISYRLAFGPNAGKKALTLQTLPATFDSGDHDGQVIKRVA